MAVRSPLRNYIARKFLADLDGDVSVDRGSVGWLSPVVLEGVEIRDARGRPALTVPRFVSEHCLAALLVNRAQLGKFTLEGAAAEVYCGKHDTNLERVFAAWLKPSADASADGTALELNCANAVINLHDEETGRNWVMRPVRLSLDVPARAEKPLRLEVHAQACEGDATNVDAELSLHYKDNSSGPTLDSVNLRAHATAFPAEMVAPLLRRLEPGTRIRGTMDARLEWNWQSKGLVDSTTTVDAQMTGRNVQLAGPWLGKDRLDLEKLDVPCRFVRDGSRLRIERVAIECDLGKASGAGTLDTTQTILDSLACPGCEIRADVDLARVAKALPHLCRLHHDSRINSGRLTVDVRSTSDAAGIAWRGSLRTTDLQGTRSGRSIVWKDPIALRVAAHRDGSSRPVIDELHCDSGFLQFDVSGSLEDRLTGTARCDLGRLTTELAQFVDLDRSRLGGLGTARVTLSRTRNDGFEANARCEIRQMSLEGVTARPYHADRLNVSVNIAGSVENGFPRRLDSADLRAEAGREVLEMRLVEPVADLAHGIKASARLRLQGDVARWREHAQLCVPIPQTWTMSGQGDFSAVARFASRDVDFHDLRLTVQNLRSQALGLFLNEPVMEVKGAGHWQRDSGKLELTQTSITSQTLSLQSPRLYVNGFGGTFPDVKGSIRIQADLARLRSWLQDPAAPPGEPIAGTLTGTVDFAPSAGRPGARAEVTAQNLQLGPMANPHWREPNLRLSARGSYDADSDTIRLESLQIGSALGTCNAAGSLGRIFDRQDLALSGSFSYDLETVTPYLRPHVGNVRVMGKATSPFHLQGSLGAPAGLTARVVAEAAGQPSWAKRLSGDAGLEWTKAEGYGFSFGPARLQARLSDGWIRMPRVECDVNQGRLRVEPSIRLTPGPVDAQATAGTILDHVRVTPQMCASALSYALPALAGVADADGQFSMALDGGHVPLSEPAKADLSGKLTIHAIRVGPGPLVRELTVLVKSPAAAQLTRESVVPFRVVNGRVYHENMELNFPNLTIRTRGSVGLDGTLALTAEMPVPAHWLPAGQARTALANQTIRLPIGGTLDRPRLDAEALKKASGQFVRDAAEGAIRDELNRRLDQLIRPKK